MVPNKENCTIKFKEFLWKKSLILNMRTSNLDKFNLESRWCVGFGGVLGVGEVGGMFQLGVIERINLFFKVSLSRKDVPEKNASMFLKL